MPPPQSGDLGPIATVTASGSQRFTPAEIVAASGLRPGQSFRQADVQAGVDRLMATHCFAIVAFGWQSGIKGAIVTLTTTDAADFGPARFDNFVWFQPSEVQAALASVPLYHGALPLRADGLAAAVAQRLQQLLAARGLPGHVVPRLDVALDTGRPKAVTFVVEGVAMPIHSVATPGVSPARAAALASELALCTAHGYSALALEPCVQSVAHRVYFDRGYLAARLGPIAVQALSQDASGVPIALTIPVVEGRQYRIASLTWHGNQAIPSVALAQLLPAHPPWPMSAVLDAIASARRAYKADGYIDASLEPEAASLDAATAMAGVAVAVSEGRQFRMGTLTFSGAIAPGLAAALRGAWQNRPGAPFDSAYYRYFIRANIKLLAGHAWVETRRRDAAAAAVDIDIHFVH